MNVQTEQSCKINEGILASKLVWVRKSIRPTTTDDDVSYIKNAIQYIAKYHQDLAMDYKYVSETDEFRYKEDVYAQKNKARKGWFKF